MKTYKETDDLSKLRVGDVLELNDGEKHKAVKDGKDSLFCHEWCSMAGDRCAYTPNMQDMQCEKLEFHFIKAD